MAMLDLIAYQKLKYKTYFTRDEIDVNDTNHKMVRKYRRLEQIEKEINERNISDEEAWDMYEFEVMRIFNAIKNKQFVCKVKRISYLGGLKILAEFWGDYYVEIDFAEYMYEYPDLQLLKREEIFKTAEPDQYHVWFGEHGECDVPSDFIWHYGEKKIINPDDYEWVWDRAFARAREYSKKGNGPRLGFPKYKIGDMVTFRINRETKVGKVSIVDAYGTFGQNEEPSYDIYVKEEGCLYKHFRESQVEEYLEE